MPQVVKNIYLEIVLVSSLSWVQLVDPGMLQTDQDPSRLSLAQCGVSGDFDGCEFGHKIMLQSNRWRKLRLQVDVQCVVFVLPR